MTLSWFPLLWWYEDGYTIISTETEEGKRIKIKLEGRSDMKLNMRRWYTHSDDGIMMCPKEDEAARILYVSSKSDIYGKPTSIHAYDGHTSYHWDDEATIHFIKLWIEYKPHLLVMDRHEEYVCLVRHSLLLWALGRVDDHLPYRKSKMELWHQLYSGIDGKIQLHHKPLSLIPRGCMYFPVDQWIWLDRDHRSILLHYVHGKDGKKGMPSITRHIPSWHRIRKDEKIGYRNDYIFDFRMYAHTMMDDVGNTSICRLMYMIVNPSDSVTFMRPSAPYSYPLHLIGMSSNGVPVIDRCKILYDRYRDWIGIKKYLFYCHVLNGTQDDAAMIQMMPSMNMEKDTSNLGLIQRRRMTLLLDLMKGSGYGDGSYIVTVDSVKMLSFCKSFKKQSTKDNVISILHEEFLIDGASYVDDKLYIPTDNIVAW